MNKADANLKAKKIYEKWQKEREKIEKEAKEKGEWLTVGLDSNNYLFKEVDDKAKQELKKLDDQIDD